MQTKLLLPILASVAAVSLAQAQTSSNLLVNPSFEQPGYAVSSGWSGQVPGWSNDNSAAILDSGVRDDSAPDGNWNAYMFGADSMAGAYPYQTTQHLIEAGEVLQLAFDAAPISGSTGPSNGSQPLTVPLQLEAEVYYLNNGNRTLLATNLISWYGPSLAPTNGWETYSLTVDASTLDPNSIGKPVGVEFWNATTDPNGFNWVALDKVGLTVVPEPDTIALLAVSTLALSMVVFRRRRR